MIATEPSEPTYRTSATLLLTEPTPISEIRT